MCEHLCRLRNSFGLSLQFVELSEGIIFKDKQFTVECMLLDHGIDSYGFRVKEADHEGMLLVEKLVALGIPAGPIYGKLKQGQKVTLQTDGKSTDKTLWEKAKREGS